MLLTGGERDEWEGGWGLPPSLGHRSQLGLGCCFLLRVSSSGPPLGVSPLSVWPDRFFLRARCGGGFRGHGLVMALVRFVRLPECCPGSILPLCAQFALGRPPAIAYIVVAFVVVVWP
jgi:hypothetical protein